VKEVEINLAWVKERKKPPGLLRPLMEQSSAFARRCVFMPSKDKGLQPCLMMVLMMLMMIMLTDMSQLPHDVASINKPACTFIEHDDTMCTDHDVCVCVCVCVNKFDFPGTTLRLMIDLCKLGQCLRPFSSTAKELCGVLGIFKQLCPGWRCINRTTSRLVHVWNKGPRVSERALLSSICIARCLLLCHSFAKP
jgi:hypothetical protein